MSDAAIKSLPKAASGSVCTGLSKYYGYIVSVVTATATILVRDGTDATGVIVDSIPAATAVGGTKSLVHPIQCTKGIFFDLNGATGTVQVLYEGQ